jgi:hypothetical protein
MKAWETIRAKKLAAKSGVPAPAAAPAPAAPHAPAAVAASPAPAPASAPPAAPHTPAAAPHAPAAPATQPADSPARARALKAWETMRAKKAALAASPGAPGAAPKGPSTPATPAAPAAPKAPREKKVEYSPSKTHKTVQAAYHEAMATGASDVDAHEDAINIAKEMGADDAQAAFHADAARDRHNREASKPRTSQELEARANDIYYSQNAENANEVEAKLGLSKDEAREMHRETVKRSIAAGDRMQEARQREHSARAAVERSIETPQEYQEWKEAKLKELSAPGAVHENNPYVDRTPEWYAANREHQRAIHEQIESHPEVQDTVAARVKAENEANETERHSNDLGTKLKRIGIRPSPRRREAEIKPEWQKFIDENPHLFKEEDDNKGIPF